jgi:putative protease
MEDALLAVKDQLAELTGRLKELAADRDAQEAGLEVRGDFGLNVYNARSLDFLRRRGLVSATASFELSLARIRDMKKPLPVEVIVYGRLPLMLTENCIVRGSSPNCGKCGQEQFFCDRKGERFPVARAYGCRNVILNSHPLYLADKILDFHSAGISALRLSFTGESPREAASIAESYLVGGGARPARFTRGLYYKGVD